MDARATRRRPARTTACIAFRIKIPMPQRFDRALREEVYGQIVLKNLRLLMSIGDAQFAV